MVTEYFLHRRKHRWRSTLQSLLPVYQLRPQRDLQQRIPSDRRRWIRIAVRRVLAGYLAQVPAQGSDQRPRRRGAHCRRRCQTGQEGSENRRQAEWRLAASTIAKKKGLPRAGKPFLLGPGTAALASYTSTSFALSNQATPAPTSGALSINVEMRSSMPVASTSCCA